MVWGRLIVEETSRKREASCSSLWDDVKPFWQHADAGFWQESTGLSCGTSRRLPSCLPLQVSACTLRSKIQTQRFYLMSRCFLLSRMKAKDLCFLPRSDHLVSSVRLRRTVHLHLSHTGRTSDLPSLQLHQDGSVCRRETGMDEASHTSVCTERVS